MVDTISLIVTGLLNLILASFIIYRRGRNPRNVFYTLMTVGVAFWAFGIAIFRESTVVSLIFISGELVHLAAVIIISSLLYFTFVFPSGSLPKRKIMFVLLYVFPIAISISTMIPGVVVEKVISNDGINALVYAKFFPVFALFVVIYAIWALVKMVKKYRQSSGLYRLQLRYLFLGIFISAIIGIIANLILPGVGIFKYNWIGPSGTVVMIAFIGYAIAKYRLMDIKVIINRSLIYFILVAFVTASFTFLTYFTASVFKDVKGFSAIGVTFIVSLIIVTTLEPLKRFIAKNTDKVFFRGRIDYQQLLLMLSEVISLEIDLENLTKAVTGTLTKELKLKDSIIFLPNKTGGGFTAVADEDREIGTRITKNHPLLAYLKKYRDLIVVEEMEREIADMKEGRDRKKRELIMYRLEDLGASICVPVFVEGELKTVLVLGKKLSGDIFNNDDLNLLEVFAPQLGTAIEKAKLYKEVSDFNIKLRDEVKKATNNLREANLELQSRNSFLENLQRITNLITRTLSFKSVTRDIVNSISDDLGYVGGILLLVDRDKDRIYIEAYSQSHLAKKAISLLPKPIKEYDSILSKANTLSAKVVRTGQIQTSKSFSDFVAPPVPRQVANLIQKLMGIQTTVGVPIYSEDRIVGAIIFLIDKDEEKVSDMDFSMMNALANQTGIVFKNLELVNEIQKANKQLQVANYHLKQLDEAKSEFMSIASHQLRTPLAGIMGYLSMLQEGDFGAMTPDQSKVIADVFDGSRRLIRMVNLFLNVTRIEAGRFKLNITKVDIVKVIQSEVKELRPTTAKKKLKLNFIVPKEKIPQLNVDEDKIKDVVLNLVDNAIKYTEKGGITVTVQKKDNNVLIIVKDTGVGINPTDAEKLFSKFVRGSGISRLSPDGSGLGLFIARKIVDAHKGKIWAESEGEGKGSKFSVELPVK